MDNKQLVRDYFTAFKAADESWWAKHIAPDFIRHDPGLPFVVRGPAGLRQLADALLPAIPDLELPIEDLVEEDGKVLARLRVQGTHRGDLMGVPPTGATIDIAVMDLFELRDGILIEHWALLDNLSLLKQIGVKSI